MRRWLPAYGDAARTRPQAIFAHGPRACSACLPSHTCIVLSDKSDLSAQPQAGVTRDYSSFLPPGQCPQCTWAGDKGASTPLRMALEVPMVPPPHHGKRPAGMEIA